MMVVIGALLLFPVLMALAASSDLFTMTISNKISIALIAAFIVMAGLLKLPVHDLVSHFSCGLAVLAITFGLFCLGWIGGGDAKLAAATAVWMGWPHMLDYALTASLLGSILTIGLLAGRMIPLPYWANMSWLTRLHDTKSGVPYGIALAAAGLIVYPSTQIWLRAKGY